MKPRWIIMSADDIVTTSERIHRLEIELDVNRFGQ